MRKDKKLIAGLICILVCVLYLASCSVKSKSSTNGETRYDHVVVMNETDPYYIIGFADYVFIGSISTDGASVMLPNENQKMQYGIHITECLKGNLNDDVEVMYPAYYDKDGTLVLMEGDTRKDDGLPEKGKEYIFVGTAQPDGAIFLESLYAKADYSEENYLLYTDYVTNEKKVKRERFKSIYED